MRTWQLLSAGLACLLAAACRSDPNAAIVERELRLQEDRIYQLQECIDDYEATVESCRRENATLRNRLASGEAKSDDVALPPGSARIPRAVTAPAHKSPGRGAGEEIVTPPAVELPGQILPEGSGKPPARELRPAPEGARGGTPPVIGGPVLPGLGDAESQVIRGNSRQVAKITLNRMLTGGYNTSGRPGTDGVLVVIEPRDAAGNIIEAPAQVSVSVVDPTIDGPAGYVARWDFEAAEIAQMFRKTLVGRAIELEMPWPADPPAHHDLHLFVRYATSDGRKLQAERPIEVDVPVNASERWTPAEPAPPPAVPGVALSGPALQADRRGTAWRAAPPDSQLRTAARASAAEATPLPEGRGGIRTAALPSRPAESKPQRPVWSPNR